MLAACTALGACTRETGTGSTGSGASASSARTGPAASGGASSSAPAASGSAEPGSAGEEQRIREVFVQYKEAIAKSKGEAAASLVSEKTIAYFEQMRVAALTMPAAEVKQSPLMDRTMILATRARVAKGELARWHGRELFVHAVDQGWVGKEAQRLAPDLITIDGTTASLGLRAGTETVPPSQGFKLYQEAGGWKLDVISVARADSASMKAVQKELAQIDPDPNRALVKLIEMLTGKPVGPEIWEPLERKK